MAEYLQLSGFRNETWNPTIEFVYSGDPIALTEATVAMQWRQYQGMAGLPLIDLPGADGTITFSERAATSEEIAAGEAPAGGRILSIFPVIARDVLEPLPSGLAEGGSLIAPEAGDADLYQYDVVFTLADGTLWNAIGGEVALAKGVTG